MIIRRMSAADMAHVLEWAAAEGWNPGVGDAPLFMLPDPAGLFVADQEGQVVGSIGMPRFGPGYAFAGMYIVRPEHRGGLVGARLALEAFRHAGTRIVGTDGVLEHVEDYASLGFVPQHSHHRHSGIPAPADHASVRAPHADDLGGLVAIDDACFPGERREFMRAWLGGDHVVRMWAHPGERAEGFGVARRAVEGWRIGPLLAPDAAAAEALIRALGAALPGEVLHLDVNTGNADALLVARDLGLAPGFECVRMYRGGVPDLPTQRIWGACTLELG